MALVDDLKIKIFADGADLGGMLEVAKNPLIKSFTTHPTIRRKAGGKDYANCSSDFLAAITDQPISFEVFADDFGAMIAQAREIDSWGANVNVKIPVSNTAGTFAGWVISRLSADGIVLN